MNSALFWSASTDELKKGYTINKKNNFYTCIFCGKVFESGIIYPVNKTLCDAQKAVHLHVQKQHLSVFDFYLNLGRIYTGLSASQTELAKLFYDGLSDKEIVALTGANSVSTIRNQRFAIREKYKQAKILVALVELLEEKLEQIKHEGKPAPSSEKLVTSTRRPQA